MSSSLTISEFRYPQLITQQNMNDAVPFHPPNDNPMYVVSASLHPQLADDLLASMDDEQFASLRLRGKTMLRRKQWWSDARTNTDDVETRPLYVFPSHTQMPAQQNWTPLLARLRDNLSRVFGVALPQAIATLYSSGKASIGYHKDKHDDCFIIVSLGDTRALFFTDTPKPNKTDLLRGVRFDLSHGSVLFVSKEANRQLFHGLHPQSRGGRRISIVFRPITTWKPVTGTRRRREPCDDGDSETEQRAKRHQSHDSGSSSSSDQLLSLFQQQFQQQLQQFQQQLHLQQQRTDELTKLAHAMTTMAERFSCDRDETEKSSGTNSQEHVVSE